MEIRIENICTGRGENITPDDCANCMLYHDCVNPMHSRYACIGFLCVWIVFLFSIIYLLWIN